MTISVQDIADLIGRYKRRYPARSELIYTIGLAVAICVTAVFFTNQVWIPASREGNIIPVLFATLATVLGGETQAYWAITGFVLGLGLMWLSDDIKRYQTVGPTVLFVTVVYALGISPSALLSDGNGLTDPVYIFSTIWICIGFAIALQISGVPLVQRVVGRRKGLFAADPPHQFQYASYVTISLVVISTTIGLIDAHVAEVSLPRFTILLRNQGGITTNILLAGLLNGLLLPFITYKSRLRVIQLGPARAGKSAMFGGLCVHLDKDDRLFTNEGEISPAIKQVKEKDLEDENTFPDRTSRNDMDLLSFSYVSNNIIFRKKNEISSVDYGGELLTGGVDEDPISKHVESIVKDSASQHAREPFVTRLTRRVVRLARWFDPRSKWDKVLRKIEQSEESNRDNLPTWLATLIVEADMIVFTLPADDYLHSVIERAEREETAEVLPEYIDGVVYTRDPDDQEKIYIRQPGGAPVNEDGSEVTSIELDSDNGRYYFQADDGTSQLFETDFENIEELPKLSDDPERYFSVDHGEIRATPREYTQQYKRIVDIFKRKRTKQFAWTVTKSDLFLDDFRRTVERANGNNTGTIFDQYDDFANQINGEDGELSMKVLSKWILKQYIDAVFPRLSNELLAETVQDFVYPMWFSLDWNPENHQLEIRDDGRMLAGANYITRRYDGRELVSHGGLPDDTEVSVYEEYEKLKQGLSDD